jgi:hypothetical protein
LFFLPREQLRIHDLCASFIVVDAHLVFCGMDLIAELKGPQHTGHPIAQALM